MPSGAEIQMKVLVLSMQTDDPAVIGDAPQLEAAKAMLDRVGMPYEVHTYDSASPSLPVLENGNTAEYQAIVLPISDARLLNPIATNPHAQTLARYQFKYGVRVASLYSWPDDGGCLTAYAQRDTTANPLNSTLTADGRTAFPYLNAGSSSTRPLLIKGAWTYFADVSPSAPSGTKLTPLLLGKADDGSTHMLMTTCSFANATPLTGDNSTRELLMATFDNNPYLLHSTTLSYGLLNWLTKGIMVGQRRSYIDPQIDDIGLPNDIFPYTLEETWNDASTTPWTPLPGCPLGDTDPKKGTTGCEYRLTGNDITKIISWQNKVRAQTNTSAFRLTLPYNGAGFTTRYGGEGLYPPDNEATWFFNENSFYDTLSSSLALYKSNFKWVSHTYDHQTMDVMSYDLALSEMKQNDTVRSKMSLPNYDKSVMVNPNISGLYNPEVMSALQAFGIKYLVSDTSKPTPPVGASCEPGAWPLPSHNSGKPNCVNPAIYEVPRYPTALYYNVSTPSEWTAEYNHFYGINGILSSPWGRDLSYAEILDTTSDVLVSYLLNHDARPWMFHAANLRAYDGTHSLLGDLLDATLAKYNTYYKSLPILSPHLKETGALMQQRQVFNESSVKAVLKPGSGIVLSASRNDGQAVVVPLTGLSYGTSTETYGGQVTSFITLNSGNGYTQTVKKALSW
ncbi:MAG: hypothetical protein HGA71_12375 [Azonexaceae bacterium]|nr:hypothetical protein [Azonexaceae bacterium]